MNRPDILFILIDDMGWRDLTCTGSDFYETPHIDRLAADGMAFTNAYASCPVCSPTRASVLTGKYPATVGITDWIDWGGKLHPCRGRVIDVPYLKALPRDEHTLASALGEAGYATWHVGKWHLGGEGSLPTDHGFQVNIGGCAQGSPARGGYFAPWTIDALADADVAPGTYLTDHLGDRAAELIRTHAADDADRPFYLNMWFYSVHTPIQAKPAKIARYEEKARRLGIDQTAAIVEGEHYPCDHKKNARVQRRIIQSDPVYAAMIESLDENIGKLLDALEETGRLDDTLIVFTSDNGGLATSEGSPTCNLPLSEGKGWMYEGGTREPLLVRWPGRIAAGAACHVPVTTPDFYPTLLEAAGLDLIPDQHVDGVSLLPLLTGEGGIDRDAIFWHYPHYGNQGGTPGSSVRLGDYKLIEFFEGAAGNRIELYNLAADPGEHNDLSAAQPALRDRLHRRLIAWRESTEAKLPRPNPDWTAAPPD